MYFIILLLHAFYSSRKLLKAMLYGDFTTISVILGTPTHIMPQAKKNLGPADWSIQHPNHAKV